MTEPREAQPDEAPEIDLILVPAIVTDVVDEDGHTLVLVDENDLERDGTASL